MSEYLEQFIEFFGIDYLIGSEPLTVQQAIGYQISAFIGALFMVAAIRCIFELIKTVTDWRKFS